MRLHLTLHSTKEKQLIPINYQYPIASAIYRILENADEEYAAFLHEKGYGKGFKLFTFSDIKCPFKIQGDRLILLSDTTELIVCFQLPEAAETFIKGLFISQQIVIADKKSKATFIIEQVSSLASPLEKYKKNEDVEVVLKPLSPIVCGLKNETGNYTFLSPIDDRYEEMLFLNWHEKVRAIYEQEKADILIQSGLVEIIFLRNPPKSRLTTIKAFTSAETKIRGFVNFNLNIKGKKEAVELLLNSGVGLYNAQGMGCVGVRGGGD